MYISKIRPQISSLSDMKRLPVLDDYSFHKVVWSFFADEGSRKRDFLYRVEMEKGAPTFFVVSQRQPRSDQPWKMETKAYSPVLKSGQRLAFVLRANPVITKKDGKGKWKRHDVVMDAKTTLRTTEPPNGNKPANAQIIQNAGAAWLLARGGKNGFSVSENELRADGYRQRRFYKSGSQPILISTVDFSGILTVTDPDLFVRTLYLGLGPAKGFGCGLVMVRRK